MIKTIEQQKNQCLYVVVAAVGRAGAGRMGTVVGPGRRMGDLTPTRENDWDVVLIGQLLVGDGQW